MKPNLLSLLALPLLLAQCKKSEPDPASQLPAATQTGANTFGCLINGKVYIPKGTPSINALVAQYDPTLNGGFFAVAAEDVSTNGTEGLFIKGYPIKAAGAYSLDLTNPQFEVGYHNEVV